MGAISAPNNRLGPYSLGKRLGAGGMAEVYEAHREGPHGFSKRFAIKRILPQLGADPRFVAMFCDEARICAALCHPNIVQVVDFGEYKGDLFMAMEFVEGISVARLLRAVANRGQRVPHGIALFIVHEVLRALSYAHEACDEEGRPLGIIHRDVSPGNVLVGRAGEVKLTDFGIVRSAFVDRRTYPGELKGKLGYMSPEQVIGKDVDPRSDLFTLGIVLAELLLTQPLFPGKSEVDVLTKIYKANLSALEAQRERLPESLYQLTRRALARDVDERFQSAREFDEALLRVAITESLPLRSVDLSLWLSDLGLVRTQTGSHQSGTVRKAKPVGELAQPAGGESAREEPAGGEPAPSAAGPGESSARHKRVSDAEQATIQRVPFPDCAERRFFIVDDKRSVSTVQLLQLIATGRVRPDSQVNERKGGAGLLREFEAMGDIARRRAYAFFEPPQAPPVFEHVIDRKSLASVLYALALQGKSGLLTASSKQHERRIFYRQGVPVFVSSTRPEELLGNRLVNMGVLSKIELYQALEVACLESRRLGETLVKYGMIRPSMLLRVLIEQLEERFAALSQQAEGRLCFYLDIEPDEALPRSPQQGLAFVTRFIRQGYSADELGEVLAPLSQQRIVHGSEQSIDFTRLGLTRPERSAIERTPHLSSLKAALEKLESDRIATPLEAMRGIYIGLSVGALGAAGFR